MVPGRTTFFGAAPMPDGATKGSEVGDPAALKRAIHLASVRAGITSDVDLSLKSTVHYDTLMNWYSGRTVPRPRQLLMVARACNVPLESLLGPYEGREPEPDSAEEALRRHTRAVERQNELLEQLVWMLRGAGAALSALPQDTVAERAQAAISAELRESGEVGELGQPGGDDEDVPPRRLRP